MKQIPTKTLQFCVYKITNNISEKSYIGKTKNIINRWTAHKRNSIKYKTKTKFYNALRKYPEDTWNVSILYETDDESHCYEVEALLVDEYDTFKSGYNSTGGGTGVGVGINHPCFKRLHSEKTKQLMRLKAKKGKDHPNFNIPMLEEIKEKIRKSLSGEKNPMFGKIRELSPMFGKTNPNCPNTKIQPWFNSSTIKWNGQYNWSQADIIYKKWYNDKIGYILLCRYFNNIDTNIINAPNQFNGMIKWFKKNGNPINNNEWIKFKENYKLPE